MFKIRQFLVHKLPLEYLKKTSPYQIHFLSNKEFFSSNLFVFLAFTSPLLVFSSCYMTYTGVMLLIYDLYWSSAAVM
jgi:hypothetical protein